MRKVLAWSAFMAFVASGLPVAPAAASVLPPAKGALSQDAEVNASGCPVGVGVALGPGQHCVAWPVSFSPQMSGNDKACGEALFMLVPLDTDVDEYVAVWSWDTPQARAHPWTFYGPGSGPYGEEAWSTTALTPQNTGVNVHYDVPRGFGAWFVAAGGGPGPCKAETGTAQAWAVTYQREVSGQVTVQGSGGMPAPGVTVQASCPNGGTTTTDQDGDYEFLLDKGLCTIAPRLGPGDTSTPPQRVVDVTKQDIYRVDFQVPCDAVSLGASTEIPAGASGLAVLSSPSPAAAERAGPALVRFGPQVIPVGKCPLAVKVAGNLTFTSGLASPAARFFAGGSFGPCTSGCTNLVLTVVDPLNHDQAVPDATVQVSVDPLDAAGIAPYPRTWSLGTQTTLSTPPSIRLASAGTGYLCDNTRVASSASCGQVLNLKADGAGQVKLRYWAPGVTTKESTTLVIRAQGKTCGPGLCSNKLRYGHAKKTLTVRPNVVIGSVEAPASSFLTSNERYELPRWATYSGGLLGWLYNKEWGDLVTSTIEFLFTEEAVAAYGAVQQVESAVGTKDTALVGFVAMLLNHFMMAEAGLGVTSSDTSTALFPPIGDYSFYQAAGDLVKDFGKALSSVPDDFTQVVDKNTGETTITYTAQSNPMMFLTVYEVSFCEQGRQCGPGYNCESGLRCTGTQPYLDLVFSAKRAGDYGISPSSPNYYDVPVFSQELVVPYRADSWMTDQAKLNAIKAAPQGAVNNGGFAQPVVSAAAGYEAFPAGSTAVTGWTVGGDGVEAYASSFMQHPPDTTSEIRLFAGGPGSITQTIATTPGKSYVLKWEGAGEPGGGQVDKIMHVFWDGKLVAAPVFDTAGRSFTNMGWRALQVTVAATSPTSTVEFADATPDKSFWGSMVTGVSLRALS
jgi:hypothetical protein